MEQMSMMDCSEEESVLGSETEDPNLMDYNHELIDEVPDEASNASASIMEKPNTKLSEMIQASEFEKQQYEEILKNQYDNIVELQQACEKASWLLDQLPLLKERNSLCFNDLMSELHCIKQKQSQLNELIEFTVQIYDDNMKSIYAMKQEFEEHRRMNDERRTVFNLGVQEIPELADTIYAGIEKKIQKKREYCWILNNYLAEVAKAQDSLEDLNVKIDVAFVNATDLNKQLLEYESQLELSQRSNAKLNAEMKDKKENFIKELEVLLKREEEYSEKLSMASQKVNEIDLQLKSSISTHIKLQKEVTSTQEKLEALNKEKQEKASCRTTLACQLDDVENQERTLSESLSGLTRCKEVVTMLDDEVKSLETEFNEKLSKSDQLSNHCEGLVKQLTENENLLRELTKSINELEKEYAKISPEVASLKSTFQKKRTDLTMAEKSISDEIVRVQSEVDGINCKYEENQKKFEEYESKFIALLHYRETRRAILKEKNSEVLQKELCMNSINEELEECKVELNDLINQRKEAEEHKNQVIKLENELSDARKELALTDENFSKHFAKLNETNNKQIEDAVNEMENRKLEYVSALEVKAKETSALEHEFKLLQTTLASLSNIQKDTKKQAEMFTCEQSLLSTFANWVFDEGSSAPVNVPTAEPSVTSTSDNNYLPPSQSANESEDYNFVVKEIKTAGRTE